MAYLVPAFRVVLTLLAVALVSAQAPQNVLTGTCRRYGHQTAIIDRKLYIDGGWLYANPISDNPIPVISNKLIYSDLNSTLEGMPTQYANLTKNDTVPNVAGGTLWADEINKVFWLFGGEYATAPKAFELWGYDTVLNTWNKSDAAKTAASTIQRVAYGAGATVNGRGFYYGGYLNSLSNPFWNGAPLATSTLIRFDFNTGTLSNNTGPDSIGRAEGTMLAIPASAGGMLVYFGGVQFPYGNSTEVAQDMSQIMLFDVADNKWYRQTASGDVPANRRKFCAGVDWAPDQSSYNIYLYGGFGFGANSTGFDDIYILSLPTFRWIKWYPTEPGGSNPHGGLTCNVVNHGQMIVMGGNFTNHTDCDVPIVGGQHNMNLGQVNVDGAKWYQYLPNLTDYSVPKDIISVAGGSSDGGASIRAPPNGWADSKLQVYFNQKLAAETRTATRYIPSATAAVPTSTGKTSDSKPSIGAIAGGAVGGGIVLIIAAVLIWWFCVKKRKGQTQHPNQNQHQGHGQVQHGTPQPQIAAGELNADPNRYSKTPASFNQVPSPGPQPHSGSYSASSSPPPQHMYQQQMPGMQQYFPPQMQQQGYGPQPLYQQPYYPPVSSSLPAGQMFHQQQTQQYPQAFYPPPDNPRLSPPAHEMPVRGMTPGTYQVQQNYMPQPTPQRMNVHGIESVSERSGGDPRLDSRSQSTHSPTNSTWKG